MEGGVGETISNPPAKKPSKGSRAKPKTSLPDDFGISERVRRWATDKGVIDLEAHHESFCLRARARGYTYSDWDAALMTAIRDDWAGLARGRPARYQQRQQQSLTDTMDDWLAIYGSGLPEVEGEGEFIDGEATNVRH